MERNLTFVTISLLQIALFASPSANAQPVRVEIIQNETGYELHRAGEPYYIKGAGAKEHFGLLEES